MKIFISHSHQDKFVAKQFKKLFESFNRRTEVFVSSDITGDQIKSRQWQKNFEENLKDCSLVVVVVTPNSLNSSWVHYEIGYAKAKNINEIIPIGIKGVSPEDFFMKEDNMQIVKENDDVIKLISNIFDVPEEVSEVWCENKKKIINELLGFCRERCVYFVGSDPAGDPGNKEWKERAKVFLDALTTELLKREIKVSSFPTVEEVGKVVWEAVNRTSHTNLYEISGLYNFDKLLEEEKDLDKQNTWRDILRDFRRLYLKNKSSMVVIGGGTHTKEEYDVAHNEFKQIEIFPIPCFGGKGKELFDQAENKEEKLKKFNHPCYGCDYNRNGGICHRIPMFVERLSQYKYINEDERES